ncbi:MAG: hypothetical protein ACRDL7_15085, partial [Gaiellaceae bacterium]
MREEISLLGGGGQRLTARRAERGEQLACQLLGREPACGRGARLDRRSARRLLEGVRCGRRLGGSRRSGGGRRSAARRVA